MKFMVVLIPIAFAAPAFAQSSSKSDDLFSKIEPLKAAIEKMLMPDSATRALLRVSPCDGLPGHKLPARRFDGELPAPKAKPQPKHNPEYTRESPWPYTLLTRS